MFSNTHINPLHPKLSMHILHTVLYTFSVADGENLFNNQEPLYLVIFSFILVTLGVIQGNYCRRNYMLVNLRCQRVN